MTPGELSALVDKYYSAREQRLAAAKEVEKLEAAERELKYSIMAYCSAHQISSIGGNIGKVTYAVTDEPVATDWEALHKYVKERDAFDLFQRRLHAGAVKQRWEDGLEIPGVGHYPVEKLSVSKVKR